jgi:hypothetical protein
MSPDNWNYVAVGYAVSAVSLVGYTVWLRVRSRKLRKLLSGSDGNRDD